VECEAVDAMPWTHASWCSHYRPASDFDTAEARAARQPAADTSGLRAAATEVERLTRQYILLFGPPQGRDERTIVASLDRLRAALSGATPEATAPDRFTETLAAVIASPRDDDNWCIATCPLNPEPHRHLTAKGTRS
jgi:hypothetical protein